MTRRYIFLGWAALFTLLFMLSACTPTVTQHGNTIESHQMEQVVPTVHTQSDVLRIFGSPTTTAPFDPNTWYYIGQETEKRGILDPDVTAEQIVMVRFDAEGIVHQLERVDAERLDVPIVRTKTPTHGNDVNAVQQLLGNLGKFNPQTNQDTR